MPKIAINNGSSLPVRKGEVVGKWAYCIARKRDDAKLELLDGPPVQPGAMKIPLGARDASASR